MSETQVTDITDIPVGMYQANRYDTDTEHVLTLWAGGETIDMRVNKGPSDPYAAWFPSRATDDPDGLPDAKIVPLIEQLRKRGIVTLQSCAGHPGESDGHIMFAPATLPTSIRQLRGYPFSTVRETLEPEPWFELWWHPKDVDAAITCIALNAACRFCEDPSCDGAGRLVTATPTETPGENQ